MTNPVAPQEVRQCIDPESEDFGTVAVKLPGFRDDQNYWGVMHVRKGGEWAVDFERVKDWAVATLPEYVKPEPQEETTNDATE